MLQKFPKIPPQIAVYFLGPTKSNIIQRFLYCVRRTSAMSFVNLRVNLHNFDANLPAKLSSSHYIILYCIYYPARLAAQSKPLTIIKTIL